MQVELCQIRVLIVDDSPLFIRSLCSFLGRWPEINVVATANSGAQALAEVDRLLPDLVLLDFQMPGMHGLEAFDRIHRQHPSIRFIMLTAHDTPELRQVSLANGFDDLIPKSRLVHELPSVLGSILRCFPSNN